MATISSVPPAPPLTRREPGLATFPKAMPSYRELLQQVKSEIDEVDVARAREILAGAEPPLLVDVRELDEWTEGRIPGAIHIPRGNLESRIEAGGAR